ncbi:hypothetical protein CROQUDRAFT_135012 [Cronartium quercuum f. sp. fusiforme G11]|uniref:DUF7872 domain-containing protein n=1 Tax=Cronartium quercuum f. sp. fusiforme G11 TaxID=708437 RepID=A0A9P6T9C2_9BASI|nr:hypothetical protein CROQUDRAFT_135012 [Cronartium quercuum f. sp. fusiforme G11]
MRGTSQFIERSRNSTDGQGSASLLTTNPCAIGIKLELNPQLWVDENMDEYMKTLGNQTIAEYTTSLGMPNSQGGLGFDIWAGQICYPAIGKDFLVMYSLEKWNAFMNNMYTSVESVTLMLMDISSAVVADFIPPGVGADMSIFGYAIATVVIGILATFTGVIAPLIIDYGAQAQKALYVGDTVGLANEINAGRQVSSANYMAARAAMDAKNIGLLNAAISAHDVTLVTEMAIRHKNLARGSEQFPVFHIPKEKMVEINKLLGLPEDAPRPHRLAKRDMMFEHTISKHRQRLHKRDTPNVFTYIRWSFMDTHLASLKLYLQDWISFTMQVALMAPMYSDKGVAPNFSGGAFMAPNPSWTTLAEQSKKLGYISLVSDLLTSLGYMATIGMEPCKGKGENGAWKGDKYLSHCNEKGLMLAIVAVQGDKIETKIHNVHLLKSKYNFEVEDLVNRAWDCQSKYGPYGNNTAPPPSTAESDCAFQMPVCDYTDEVSDVDGSFPNC